MALLEGTWGATPRTPLAGPRQQGTLADVLAAGRAGAAALVVPDGPCLTYAAVRGDTERFAEHLAGLGIGRGQRVAIVVAHPAEAALAFLGVSRAAAAAPLNPGLTESELRTAMRDMDVAAVVVPHGDAGPARRALPDGAQVIEAGFGADGRYRAAAGSHRGTPAEARPDDVALVLHSSGTTGRPKRVALRHRHLAASVRRIVATYALGPDDVSLAVMPLFHVHGLVAALLASLAGGGTTVFPRRFAPGSFRRLVRAHRVTWCTAVPTIHQLVLARDRDEGQVSLVDPLEGLRFIRSASAKLPPETQRALEARFGVPVLEAYGMTEAAHQIASNALPPASRVAGTVGRGTGVDVAIMDEAGRLLPAGATGEVVLRGPSVIERYDGMPDVDEVSFQGGWFRTGDLGVLDRTGQLTLVGRIREMINRAGEKVSPLEVEEALAAHPAVAEAVCFALPDPDLGEEVAAAVVLRSPARRGELLRHCRERLAAFKVPKQLLVVEAIPRSAVGKVQRRAMPALLGLVA